MLLLYDLIIDTAHIFVFIFAAVVVLFIQLFNHIFQVFFLFFADDSGLQLA